MVDDHEPDHVYQIKVQGRLGERWANWFEGLAITYENATDGSSNTTLTGAVADQPALRGILSQLWDLNLVLVSVNRIRAEKHSDADGKDSEIHGT